MPNTLILPALDLEPGDLAAEKDRAEQERREREVKKRSINFGETALDTSDGNFASRLCEIANAALSRDETWLQRSRRPKLATFAPSQPTSGGGGGGRSKGRYSGERQLNDAQRSAMGLASEWLAYQFLQRRHPGCVNEASWISGNRSRVLGGDEGDDGAGCDFLVKTPQAEWLYEVKSSLEDAGEIELTANELRVAGSAAKDGRHRYRILYVPYVSCPDKWFVLELPNPMGERTKNNFDTVGPGPCAYGLNGNRDGPVAGRSGRRCFALSSERLRANVSCSRPCRQPAEKSAYILPKSCSERSTFSARIGRTNFRFVRS